MSNYKDKQLNKGHMNNDNLPTMPIMAAKDQQASPPRPSPVRTYAALGTYPKRSNLPEAPASTGIGDAGEGGLVFEGGREVRYELYQPKGSMCMACAFKNQDCSSLDFAQMKVMFVLLHAAVVRCTAFIPEKLLGPIA